MARKKGRYNALVETGAFEQSTIHKEREEAMGVSGIDLAMESGVTKFPVRNTYVTGQKAVGMRTPYKVALYARISGTHRERESDSLESQLLMLEDFAKNRPEFAEYREFSDRNYSGTNFNRPAFQEMMQEVREGRINCIIVKDLSRLGRDYLEAGHYIETIFPFLGVRFISVNDHFDTNEETNGNKAMMVSIMNLVNDLYARDISKRATCTIRAKIEKGSYTGGQAPYGYRIAKNNLGFGFAIDEPAAEIVRYIFTRYLELGNLNALARELTEMRIRIPGEYQSIPKVYLDKEESGKVWYVNSIREMLLNEAYIGHMVQGKKIKHKFEGIKEHKTDKSEWTKVENTHEPIISTDIFLEVQELLKKNGRKIKSRTDEIPMEEDIFDGLLYCPYCGKKIRQISSIKRKKKMRHYHYFCNHSSVVMEQPYENCNIAKYELKDAVIAAIMDVAGKIPVDKKALLTKLEEKEKERKAEFESEKRMYNQKLHLLESKTISAHGEYVKGIITKDEFASINRQAEEKKAAYQKELALLQEEAYEKRTEIKTLEKWLIGFLQALDKKGDFQGELTKEFLQSMIKRIELYPNRKLIVEFTFGAETELSVNRLTHEVAVEQTEMIDVIRDADIEVGAGCENAGEKASVSRDISGEKSSEERMKAENE